MRIVAGQWRGRHLAIPKGRGIRPTLERVREAMFDVLQADIPDAVVLDLCAGSGALGFEALSRGARRVRWCDADHRCIDTIRENAQRLGVVLTAKSLYAMPVLDAVWRIAKGGEPFDVVFFDPPRTKPTCTMKPSWRCRCPAASPPAGWWRSSIRRTSNCRRPTGTWCWTGCASMATRT